MKKVKLNKSFLRSLHELVYDESNTTIVVAIDQECRNFMKRLEEIYLSEELQ